MQAKNPTTTTSEARIRANRQNAQKSTGPRSPEGKAVSSRNSLTHGLTARKHFLPGQPPEELLALLEDLYGRFRPVGPGEEKLVRRIAADQWRLDRAVPIEVGILRDRLKREGARVRSAGKGRTSRDGGGAAVPRFARPPQMAGARRVAFNRAHPGGIAGAKPESTLASAAPISPDDALAAGFMIDCESVNCLAKLARYETAIERSISRTLRLLDAFQIARRAAARAVRTGSEPPAAPAQTNMLNYETNPTPGIEPNPDSSEKSSSAPPGDIIGVRQSKV